MNRRYGPPRLFVCILAWLLLPCVCWSAPQSQTLLASKVECVVSSPTVATGQSVTLTSRLRGDSTGLTYSFSSSGGKLYPNGSTARLDTAEVPAGITISVTCLVVDGVGQRSSGEAIVRVVASTTQTSTTRPAADTSKTFAELQAMNAAINAQTASVKSKNEDFDNEMLRESKADSPTGGHARTAAHPADQQAQSASDQSQGASGQAAQSSSEETQTAGKVSSAGQSSTPPVMAAAEAPAPAPPPPAAGGDPYQQAEQVLQWKNELKNGKIDYLIPPQMKLHETAVVQVVVHGYADTSQNNLPGAKTGTLKVSPRMQMQLTAEDNPDEFEIDPKAGAIQFVPIDGSTTWTWNITPKQPAENQRLTIRALLVYPDNGQQIEQEITSYIATVSVRVPGFWESIREEFWNNPSAAIKYVLPGGAGFTAAAGLIVWWWKRRHPSEDKPKKDE